MSIRKRTWKKGRDGSKVSEAWIVDYVDQNGRRVQKTFKLKHDATAFDKKSGVEVMEGTHVADSASITVAEAGKLWIKSAEAEGLERTTINQYKQHLNRHIIPFLGDTKLSRLTVPTVRGFKDTLREAGRSPTMVKYAVRSLGSLLADAQERGSIIRNPVHERKRRKGQKDERRKRKLVVGVDIPTPDEINQINSKLAGKFRPLLLTAIFTGLRASELRGLKWQDVDLENAKLHVRQRADVYNKIDKPKTAAGERTVALPPMLVNTLREWKLAYPKGKLGLVFPNGAGNVEAHSNIVQRGLLPVQIAAGITVPVLDASGEPTFDENGIAIVRAKYTGLHALRHFYASWCASIGMSMKEVQESMGHSNIAVTMDTYTHLFPKTANDSVKLAAAERLLLRECK